MAHRPDVLERFRTETNALRKLRHPCIVALLGAGMHRGRPYIMMEYVKGRTLREVLRLQRERLGLSQTLQIALHIGAALRAAHKKGVVHRDLKPENVLLQKGGTLKVVDFGMAKLRDGAITTDRLTPMATPLYAAPEQLSRGRVDGRTDVYALGLMILEMATGRYGFSDLGETMPAEELAAELQRRARPNRLIDDIPRCPPTLSVLVEQALSKRREDRPTAAELVRALRREASALGYTLVEDEEAGDDEVGDDEAPDAAPPDAAPPGAEAPMPRETIPMQRGLKANPAFPHVPAPKFGPPPPPVQGPTGTHLMAETVASLLAKRGQTLEEARQERQEQRLASLPPPPTPYPARPPAAVRFGAPPAAPALAKVSRAPLVTPAAEAGAPARPSRLSMLTFTLPSPRKWLPVLVVGMAGLAVLFVLFALVMVGVMWAAVHLGLVPTGRGPGGVESAPPSSASAAPAKEVGR
jgi:hypothetical protein